MISSLRRAAVLVFCAALGLAPGAQAGLGSGSRTARVPAPTTCADSTGARLAPAPPVGYSNCPTIRPGDYVWSKLGDGTSACTVGFLYRDRRGDTYFATGADCAPPYNFAEAVTTWPRGKGPAAYDGYEGQRIGEWAFRYSNKGMSLSLVRLHPAVAFDPQVCSYGGPTSLTTAVGSDPTELVMVGPQGFLSRQDAIVTELDGSVARPGLADLGLYDADYLLVQGESLAEEGMPVVTADGEAVGLAGFYTANSDGPAGMRIGLSVTRLATPIAVAEKALRTRLTMLTAPLL